MKRWLLVCLLTACDQTTMQPQAGFCPSCSQLGTPHPADAAAAWSLVIRGTWYSCNGVGLEGFGPNQAGLRFDMRGVNEQPVEFLRYEGGGIVQGEGMDYFAHWQISDTADGTELELTKLDGTVMTYGLHFDDGPLKLYLYRPGSPSVFVLHCPLTDAMCTGQNSQEVCTTEGPPLALQSLDDLHRVLTGAWLFCQASAIREGWANGIELTADGHYYQLLDDGVGGLIRDQGYHAEGSWSLSGSPADPHLIVGANDLRIGFDDPPRRFFIKFDNGDTRSVAITACQTVSPQTGLNPNACNGGTSASCPLRQGPLTTYSDEAGFRALVLGRWFKCGGLPFDSLPDPTMGMELTDDGHLTLLYFDPSGTFTRGRGPMWQGYWLMTGSAPQIRLQLFNAFGMGLATTPLFELQPDRMLLQIPDPYALPFAMARDCGDLAPVDAAAGSDACSADGPPVYPAGVVDLQMRMVGLWRACSRMLDWPGDVIGIEFAADGTVYGLVNGSGGTPVRGTGAVYTGTWQVGGGPPWSLSLSHGMMATTSMTAVEDTPRKLYLDPMHAFVPF